MANWENKTLELKIDIPTDSLKTALESVKGFNDGAKTVIGLVGDLAELLSFTNNPLLALVEAIIEEIRTKLVSLRDAGAYYLFVDLGTYGTIASDRTKSGADLNVAVDLIGRVSVDVSGLKKTLTHSRIKELMARATEDLGDNPRYEFDSILLNGKELYGEQGETLISNFDPNDSNHVDILTKKAVYDLGSTPDNPDDYKSKRSRLNTQIKPGRPGAYDDSEEVGGVAIIFGASSGQQLVGILKNAAILFNQLPGFIEAISDLEAQYISAGETERLLELTKVDSNYGLFSVGDKIIGTNNPPEIVEVVEVVKSVISDLTYVDTTTSPSTTVNLNPNGNYYDQILKVKTIPDKLIGLLMKNSLVYEAEPFESGYRIRGINTIDVPFGKGRIYPKYGTVKGDDGMLDSTPPDFGGIRLKSLIPRYDDFFSEVINYLDGFLASLEGSVNSISDFLDQVSAELEEESEKLDQIINLLGDTLNLLNALKISAGASILMIPEGTKAKDLPNLIRNSFGGFGEDVQYCSGVLLLGNSEFAEIFKKIFPS